MMLVLRIVCVPTGTLIAFARIDDFPNILDDESILRNVFKCSNAPSLLARKESLYLGILLLENIGFAMKLLCLHFGIVDSHSVPRLHIFLGIHNESLDSNMNCLSRHYHALDR
jgi:hypothetical protein